MRTTLYSLTTGLLTSMFLLSAGCGAEEDFDLSSLPLVTEDDSKQDSASDSSPLIWTRPSASSVNCVRFPCPTHMIYDINVGQIRLAYAYDWRALKLTKSQEQAAEANASNLLLYGRYTSAKVKGEPVQVYQITRANQRVSERAADAPETSRYYSTQTATDACPQGPCTALRAQLLNQPATVPALWPSVDLGRLELSTSAAAQLQSELQKGKAYVSLNEPARQGQPAPVSQAFRPLLADPLK